MKAKMTLIISFSCILIVGCVEQEQVQKRPDEGRLNAELVNSFNDIAMQNAIISQHTLFPYHFVNNGTELNELGQRDLGVLTKHFMDYPGPLNVRRGDIPTDLYNARVNLVIDRLKEAGVSAEQIAVSDGMPGGSGMPSERVLIILEDTRKATPAETGTTFSTGIRR